jgi:hypothetical protein
MKKNDFLLYAVCTIATLGLLTQLLIILKLIL